MDEHSSEEPECAPSPREILPARLARRQRRVASVRLLRHGLLDEAADVRQAAVRSTRAAGLDRRRVRVEADDADAHVGAVRSGSERRLGRKRP